jgi:Rrf2 family nitric oxide-sensitive transcriptional repressor
LELSVRLTTFTDYTLRVLIYLGAHEDDGALATIGEIAAVYGISENHLMKIVHHLGKLGYLHTTRGKGGGLQLARKPHEINLGELVRATEHDMAIVTCFEPGDMRCPITPVCELRNALGQALDAFLDVLNRYTLADLLEPRAKLISRFRGTRAVG